MAVVPLSLGLVGAVVVDRSSAVEPVRTAVVDDAQPPPQAPHDVADDGDGPARPGVLAGDPVIVHRAAPVLPSKAKSTRDVEVEEKLQSFLDDNARAPYAATVLLEPSTGRVLAIAEQSTRGPAAGLALKPIAPAASVFKVVTTSALLEAGVEPDDTVCIHGGKTRMSPALLVDNGKRDRQCTTLADALAFSRNVAIAKLALAHLEPNTLRTMAARWGFDHPIAIAGADGDVDARLGFVPSTTSIPDDPFGFANTAAGFGDVKISAMHGALLASIVANEGVLVSPMVSDDVDGDEAKPKRVVDARVARALQRMMRATVAEGTAHRAFSTSPRLNVPAAGKTGSLTDYSSGLETTWFVGYAPADHPEVAVASVVVNTDKWNVRAPLAAKEALRAWFAAHPPARAAGVVARR